ncbi:MAG: hypothetical protein CMJ51_04435 [Planctomycetaceae bacterium]|nr:hypothetical protein [Planctomycetaceae bacterium]
MNDTLRIRLRNAETTDLEEQVREFSKAAVIGRSRDADLLLLDPGVSRRHAKLMPGDMGEWYVEDLHSTRGTKVNGRRLDTGEMATIGPGDLLEINPWSLLVLDENQGTTGVLLNESGQDGTIEDAVADPMLQARFEGLMDALRRTAGWTGEEELFAAMLDSLLAASDLERAMLLRIEGDETRAMSIRARRRDEERQPRGFSRTLVSAAIDREGTVRMEAHPDIAGGQSLVMSGAGEAFCRQVANDEEGVQLALYGDRVTCETDGDELVAWFDAISDLCEVALRMQRGRRAETERARFAAEMNAARAVQELLLPEADGRFEQLTWTSLAIPGLEIAGDLVDVRPVHGNLHVMLGDVTGKGTRAGLVMAGAQACADALVEEGLPPKELVERLDAWAVRNTPEMCFVTLWCGRIERDGTVHYVDAGHGLALVQRADGSIEYPEAGRRPPIGIEPMPCERTELRLEPGDALLIFSDGLIEEPGPDDPNDRYGLERVMETVERVGVDPKAIHTELVDWCGRTQFEDDLTVLVVRRDP